MNLDDLKKEVLVFDLETSSHYPDGREIPINANYEDYINNAKIKWFGGYSYKHEKGYALDCTKQENIKKVLEVLKNHDILVGFNNEEFDYPILERNGYIDPERYYTQVDCMQILGKSIFKNKSGFAYKDRGTLMGFKFKKNSLRHIAEVMGLDVQKGDIDYKIFQKNAWTANEENEIKKYLKADVMATKQMFDKLWDFWKPFTEMLDIKYIRNLSWIKSSIASLTYKCACTLMGVEPTYSDKTSAKEEMGGNVLLPKIEEAENVWYIDFASLYPHIFCMFNLFAQTCETDGDFVWHGNDLFKVKGYYNISKPHPLNFQVQDKLKERISLKKIDKDAPMIYAIKIFLNGLYGVARSSIFEQVHTPDCGWDCCSLGQQIQKVTEEMMEDFGFESIYGDTDSLMVVAKDEKYNNKKYVQECLNKIIKKINNNVPFPVETFSIDIECFVKYMMFPYTLQSIQDEEGNNIKKGNRLVKERKGNKKNYLYLYEKEGKDVVELVGLPIKKDNATHLGIKIYKEVLEPMILQTKRAKFDKQFIKDTVNEYLKYDEIMKLVSREFKCKPYNTYKNPESQLQAQISKHYFHEQDGIINLIKNKKIGKVGKGSKYCTIKEAINAKLTVDDLNLDKLWKELHPFIALDK